MFQRPITMLSDLQLHQINKAGEVFLSKRRPAEAIRMESDLNYRIQDQSIEIFELNESYRTPNQMEEMPIAKATFVKSKNHWRVFWMRADLKWHGYEPQPTVAEVADFFKLVDEDAFYCFFG